MAILRPSNVLLHRAIANPGLAAIHSALLAAHIPIINGVELNSPQFTPDANKNWLPRGSELFQVQHWRTSH